MVLTRQYHIYEFFLLAHLVTSLGRDTFIKWRDPTFFDNKTFVESQNVSSFFIFLLLLVYKYKQEGLRPNILLLIFSEILLLFYKISICKDYLYQYSSIFFGLAYTLDMYYHPVYKLLPEQGKYAVGYKSMQLNDPDKTEVSIYYPAVPGRKNFMKWMGKKDGLNLWWDGLNLKAKEQSKFFFIPKIIYKIFFSFLESTQIHVQYQADLATLENQEKYKVGVFCHGIPGHRNMYSQYLSDLAANGFIMLSIEYLDKLYFNKKLYPIQNKLDPNYAKQQEANYTKMQDSRQQILSIVIDSLKKEQTIQALFKKEVKIDFETIFVMGHLDGAGTAFNAIQENDRVHGCIVIDPILNWIPKDQINKKTNKFVLVIHSNEFIQNKYFAEDFRRIAQFFKANQETMENKLLCTINHSKICNFSDLPYFLQWELRISFKISGAIHFLEVFYHSSKIISQFLLKIAYKEARKKYAVANEVEKLKYKGNDLNKNKKNLIFEQFKLELKEYEYQLSNVIILQE